MTKRKHKTCYECGEPIEGGKNRKYCSSCAVIVQKRQIAAHGKRRTAARRRGKMTQKDHSD